MKKKNPSTSLISSRKSVSWFRNCNFYPKSSSHDYTLPYLSTSKFFWFLTNWTIFYMPYVSRAASIKKCETSSNGFCVSLIMIIFVSSESFFLISRIEWFVELLLAALSHESVGYHHVNCFRNCFDFLEQLLFPQTLSCEPNTPELHSKLSFLFSGATIRPKCTKKRVFSKTNAFRSEIDWFNFL